jgi:hypothetical protein
MPCKQMHPPTLLVSNRKPHYRVRLACQN